jgi:hypothetical protein
VVLSGLDSEDFADHSVLSEEVNEEEEENEFEDLMGHQSRTGAEKKGVGRKVGVSKVVLNIGVNDAVGGKGGVGRGELKGGELNCAVYAKSVSYNVFFVGQTKDNATSSAALRDEEVKVDEEEARHDPGDGSSSEHSGEEEEEEEDYYHDNDNNEGYEDNCEGREGSLQSAEEDRSERFVAVLFVAFQLSY